MATASTPAPVTNIWPPSLLKQNREGERGSGNLASTLPDCASMLISSRLSTVPVRIVRASFRNRTAPHAAPTAVSPSSFRRGSETRATEFRPGSESAIRLSPKSASAGMPGSARRDVTRRFTRSTSRIAGASSVTTIADFPSPVKRTVTGFPCRLMLPETCILAGSISISSAPSREVT